MHAYLPGVDELIATILAGIPQHRGQKVVNLVGQWRSRGFLATGDWPLA